MGFGKDVSRTGVSRKAGEAGIFVDAIINGSRVKFLIDTGATVSIISPRILHLDMKDSQIVLDKVNQKVLTADGTALKVEGSNSIAFLLSGLTVNQKFTVIDVGIDGILGLDFLTSNNCSLDLTNSCMLVDKKRVRLSFEGKIGCCRVTLAANVTIPPCSEIIEIITLCNVVTPVYEKVPDLGIIETSDLFIESERDLGARALVLGSNVAPVGLMNLSTQPRRLYKGTYVANLSEV